MFQASCWGLKQRGWRHTFQYQEVSACRKFLLYWERSYHSDEDKI